MSLEFTRDAWDFAAAASTAADLGALLLDRPLPYRTFLNVNVPQGRPSGVRVTVQAKRNHITKVDQRLDPRQRPYFWIEAAQFDWGAIEIRITRRFGLDIFQSRRYTRI